MTTTGTVYDWFREAIERMDVRAQTMIQARVLPEFAGEEGTEPYDFDASMRQQGGLSAEALTLIMNYVDDPLDFMQLRLVCKKWRRMADTTLVDRPLDFFRVGRFVDTTRLFNCAVPPALCGGLSASLTSASLTPPN